MEQSVARSVDDEVIILRDANICHEGRLLPRQQLEFSSSTGLILSSSIDDKISGPENITGFTFNADRRISYVNIEDGDVVAPGLIELQTNGLCGIHFTTLTEDNHEAALERVSLEMAKNGVTGWYATIPTVEGNRWKQVSARLFSLKCL